MNPVVVDQIVRQQEEIAVLNTRIAKLAEDYKIRLKQTAEVTLKMRELQAVVRDHGEDIEEARRDTIRQVVRYLQMMHEMVKDKHNNYMVAANLINGEFNANNQHETSNQ
jgi:hypothetical protein